MSGSWTLGTGRRLGARAHPVRVVLVTFALCGGLALDGDSALAQMPNTVADTASVVPLPHIRVEARHGPTRIGGTGAILVNLDSMARASAPRLEEVLRRVPLLHVRTNSRGEAEVIARESESRHVAVLVDGIPLTLTWDGRADVSVVPATAPVETRFVRGLASMLHGPNARPA